MIVSYNYFTQSTDTSETDNSLVANIKKQLKKVEFGILPMSYVCWLVYVLLLVWKTQVIIGPLESPDLQNSSFAGSCVDQNNTFVCRFVEYFGGPFKIQKAAIQVHEFFKLKTVHFSTQLL